MEYETIASEVKEKSWEAYVNQLERDAEALERQAADIRRTLDILKQNPELKYRVL